MTVEQLKGLEKLNEIAFTESEEQQMLAVFARMAEEEQVFSRYDTASAEPMVYVRPMTNILREDRRIQAFSRESLLSGAPEHTEDSWQVPRLVK